MFIEWDFLLAEIWGLLALSALVGLIAGWMIWGGSRRGPGDLGADADEVRRLRVELDRARAQNRAKLGDTIDDVPPMQGGGYSRPVPRAASDVQPPSQSTPPPAAQPSPQPVLEPAPPPQVDPVPAAGPSEKPRPKSGGATQKKDTAKPAGLPEARDGLPDDLTKIKGVGVKLEKLCHDLGIWHYDQIADWSAVEIEWMDANLKGFKGRVTRDNWVDQAKALARNETPAFQRRKD